MKFVLQKEKTQVLPLLFLLNPFVLEIQKPEITVKKQLSCHPGI